MPDNVIRVPFTLQEKIILLSQQKGVTTEILAAAFDTTESAIAAIVTRGRRKTLTCKYLGPGPGAA